MKEYTNEEIEKYEKTTVSFHLMLTLIVSGCLIAFMGFSRFGHLVKDSPLGILSVVGGTSIAIVGIVQFVLKVVKVERKYLKYKEI